MGHISGKGIAGLIAADVAAVYLFGSEYLQFNVAVLIALVGIITFFGSLRIIHGQTGSGSINEGEIRKTIATSVVVVFFVTFGFLVFKGVPAGVDPGLAKSSLDTFFWVVTTVVGFYFGSRTIEGVLKAGKPEEYKTIPQADLIAHLQQGWKFVAVLPNQEILIKK